MILIIMPVLNEEKNIEGTLQNVSILKGDFELIFVDGGSVEETREIAAKCVTVMVSDKGRAKQVNAGAWGASRSKRYPLGEIVNGHIT